MTDNTEPTGLPEIQAPVLPAAAQEAVAWMTHHAEPMLFPTREEASDYCSEDEQPIALYAAPVAAAPVGIDRARETPRRRRAVELLLSMGYNWNDGAWKASTPAARGIDLEPVRLALTDVYVALSCINAGDDSSVDLSQDALVRLREAIALIDASPKGDDVDDDRFPRGLVDAIEYADNMEEAAEGLYQHVFEHESDGYDSGTVILRRVLGYLKDSPKVGSDEPKIWGTQIPDSMPKLFGARHIAELNWYPDDGYDLVCVQIIERVQATSAEGGSDAQPMFYIQDTRSFVGNCPMWWAPHGAGYVTRLDEAGRFTEQEAIAQNRARGTDVPWPCAEIDKLGRITVDMQHMRPRRERLAELATSAEVGE